MSKIKGTLMLTENGKEDITSSTGAVSKEEKRELIMLVGKLTKLKRKLNKFRGRGIKTNKAY